jgi:hypothetical protein
MCYNLRVDKKQFNAMMPHDKDDVERAKSLAALDYATVEPIVPQMLRWLRTYPSPVACVFIEFFIRNGEATAEEVEKALQTSRQEHLKYAIVTQVLPELPRSAVEKVRFSLQMLVTDTGAPETALMALRLLAKHDLGDKDWLRTYLKKQA